MKLGAFAELLAAALAAGAAPILAAEAPRSPGTAFSDCADCPEMVVIAGGSFVMGTPGAESLPGGSRAEASATVIRIDRPFALGRHEITRREFAHFVARTGYEAPTGCQGWDPALERFSADAKRGWQNPGSPLELRDDHPVNCVAFADARAYVQWLARETGEPYRLPSEAEWEYAARAGSTSLRPWGDAPEAGCEQANSYDLTADAAYQLAWSNAGCRDGHAGAAPVGSFAANGFGLHDMIGNVQEWVQDCATESYVGRPRDGRAWEWLGGCSERVQRGGSWLTPPERSRSAARNRVPEGVRTDDAGFRVARDLDRREVRGDDR